MPWLSIPSVRAHHARRVVSILMMAFALSGVGQEPADSDAVLRRTRDRLLADLARMPHYTCVQTINRQYFHRRSGGASPATLMAGPQQQAGKLVQWDRLRLEVAVVEGTNIYSWVGAPQFEDDTLDTFEQFAGSGPLSSGDFGSYLNSIFSSAIITFKSEERAGQKRLLTYSYDMPADRSGYGLKCEGGWVRTAYNGTLVIDPDAGDIVSLTVRAGWPQKHPACQAMSDVEYGRTQIHDRLVLIPRQTRLITLDRKASETRSLTTYSSCREYASKSRMLIDPQSASSTAGSIDRAAGFAVAGTDPASRPPAGSQALVARSAIPAGLHFRARIVTPIDSDTAAAGDPIEAVLLSPIRGKDHQEWARAGSRLHGRLHNMAQTISPSSFQVLVQFESIELNGRAVPFRASPDRSRSSVVPARSVFPDKVTLENVFIFRKDHLHLEKFEWGWTTLTTLQDHENQPRTLMASVAQEPADPDAALGRTRERLLADLARMPRYTCVQTVTRRYYRPDHDLPTHSCAELIAAHDKGKHDLTLLRWDRLRLEVAIADGQNVFSWVGAPRFEEGTLEKLAGSGPLGSGDFGPFLDSILRSAGVSFQEEQYGQNKRLLLYSYEMPLSRSSYEIKGDKDWTPTGYSGTFLLDPVGSDIVTLKIRSDELAKNKAVCQTNNEIDYARVAIHDRAVLIPRETRLNIIDPNGGETLSTTEYSKCREYASKSKLFLEGPPGGVANSSLPAQQSPSSTLPARVHFRARIVTPIDSDTAAAGDPIEAVLLSPILGKDRQQWAPAGARLYGRLLSLTRSMSPSFFQVLVQFESIELNGRAEPFRAAPDLSGFGIRQVSVIPDRATLENVFIFRKEHLHLEKFEWGWTTLTTLQDHENQPRILPAGLHFRARIVTPIDSDTAVAGDPIEAVLLKPVRDKDGREWAPAGARLYGHLLGLKQYTLKSHSYVQVLERFEFIELDGSAVPLRAAPDLDPFAHSPYGMLVIRDDVSKENLFLFSMKHLHLENLDWDWTTLPAQESPP